MAKDPVPSAAQFWPPYVQFGDGIIENLPLHLDELKMKKPLIATDPGVKAAGILARITGILDEAGRQYAVFDSFEPNPSDVCIYAGKSAYLANNCDSIVAVGGGSAIDAGRIVRLLITHAGKVADYYYPMGGAEKITANMPPWIAIPTTSGTGAEVSTGSIITDTETTKKIDIGSPLLFANLALVDPELTASMPPKLTALTGMDALTHNIEASITLLDDQEPVELLSLYGVELAANYLRRAVADGSDREARKKMSMSALLGAMTFNSKGLGSVHALAHIITPQTGIPHGLACSIMLPYVMEYNLDYSTERLAKVAKAMGVETSGMPARDAALKGIEAVRKLAKDIGLPAKLSDAGFGSKDKIPVIAANAMTDDNNPMNPRPPREEEFVALLEAACS
ncbi:MAG: iron-containing alcohol dehydrogenase [Chloroflexi bacterium]|nr:iron-containing alcohol dehydrogenase [Chloroflexota bacterium]